MIERNDVDRPQQETGDPYPTATVLELEIVVSAQVRWDNLKGADRRPAIMLIPRLASSAPKLMFLHAHCPCRGPECLGIVLAFEVVGEVTGGEVIALRRLSNTCIVPLTIPLQRLGAGYTVTWVFAQDWMDELVKGWDGAAGLAEATAFLVAHAHPQVQEWYDRHPTEVSGTQEGRW